MLHAFALSWIEYHCVYQKDCWKQTGDSTTVRHVILFVEEKDKE